MTTPLATYRLQLHRGFTMHDAARIADDLARLGVSHLYLSPILQSAPGSTHGYDGVDPGRIDTERGGPEGLAALRNACQRAGLAIVLDIVPNHLDVSSAENRWWRSVLEHGEASPYAAAFDIEWDETAEERDRGVLAPILGQRLREALAQGHVRLARHEGRISVLYFDHSFPLSPRTYDEPLRRAAQQARPDDADAARALEALAQRSSALPVASEAAPGAAQERIEGAEALEKDLARLLEVRPAAATALDAALAQITGSPGELAPLLERQNYRLAFWRRAARELNYRRFFDITTLVGIRVERPDVFDAAHDLALGLVREGTGEGLRVDHPDGLRDPAEYFRRLADAAPGAWILAEKILEPGEALRPDWPIAGTTGYDFLIDVMGTLIDPQGEDELTRFYRELTGNEADFASVAFEAKWTAARELLAADLTRLTRVLGTLADRHPPLRADPEHLADAVAMIATCMEVYRTYVVPERSEISQEDVRLIEEACARAGRHRPDLLPQPLGALRDLLLLRLTPPSGAPRPAPEDEFVARFQQYSAPVMAKGVEDTAFYRYNRFVALSEVGGSPGRFALPPERFHASNVRRAEAWPLSMLSTSTHDTKRSEDVRARLIVLSEIPGQWTDAVRRWSAMNKPARHSGPAEIDRNMEYLIYQSLVGAWPIGADRMAGFCLKAAREAKLQTSWLDPDKEYEQALEGFVRAILHDRAFVEEIGAFAPRLLRPGRTNSLAQTLLRLTCPGVPDTYQGSELWDLSLVDPDNRRPVDHDMRRRLLDRLDGMAPASIWAAIADPDDPGIPKLWTIRRALRARRDHADAFGRGSGYRALSVVGENAKHALALARTDPAGQTRVIAVATRLPSSLQSWGDTRIELPPAPGGGAWAERLAGQWSGSRRAPLAELLRLSPVALMTEETR